MGLRFSWTGLTVVVLVVVLGAGVVRRGVETARPNWSTTNDLILSGVTGAAVETVVVLTVVVLTVVVLTVVVLAVVVLAVVVVGCAVVGLGVVVGDDVTVLAGSTTEFVPVSPEDLEDSTVGGFSVRIWTS